VVPSKINKNVTDLFLVHKLPLSLEHLGAPGLQLRGLVLEAAAREMLLPARDVSGLREDVQISAQTARDDRHVPPPLQGHRRFKNIV
jgi:hypothetical protein